MASRVDGVVLVVKGDAIPCELLRQAMAMLASVRATMVGGVLNIVHRTPEEAIWRGGGKNTPLAR